MSGHAGHEHHHHEGESQRNLLWATLLNIVITVAEVIGGLLSNSLSLLGDALHNFSDAVAVFIAYLANRISKKKSTPNKTFGYKRIEILAALFNAVVLIVICIFLFVEAVKRFSNPQEVKGGLMFIVATIGLVANLIGMLLLHKHADKNLNIKAAYLHLLGDTLSSVLVIISGILIIYKKWYWIDPVITVAIGLYIMKETWEILRQTVNILMQFAPDEIDIFDIKKEIELDPRIDNVHHVHIWNLNDNQVHFECHIDLKEDLLQSEIYPIRENIAHKLHEQFGISHSTLQFEYHCNCSKQLINSGRNR
jgi:cobalt-zinc-cadmium efflux system protein